MLPELRQLAAGQPLDERLHRQLTLALYRAGRQAEALAVIRGIRERLCIELGLDPSLELRLLELAVLRHDAVLTGAGPVVLRQSDPNARARLPRPDPAFSGRVGELAALDWVMAESVRSGAPAVVTVAGGAGVGKTSLVVHWAHLVADRFPDGRLYLNTAGVGDASLWAGQQWITPGGNYTITLVRADSIGAQLTITLNRVTVPDVKGVDPSIAIGRLHAAGLILGLVHNVVDMNCDNLNVVTGQNPAAGSIVLPGTEVSIDVTVAPKLPAHCR